jgi:hypothetical protein
MLWLFSWQQFRVPHRMDHYGFLHSSIRFLPFDTLASRFLVWCGPALTREKRRRNNRKKTKTAKSNLCFLQLSLIIDNVPSFRSTYSVLLQNVVHTAHPQLCVGLLASSQDLVALWSGSAKFQLRFDERELLLGTELSSAEQHCHCQKEKKQSTGGGVN